MGEKKSTLTNGDIMAARVDGWKRQRDRTIPITATDAEELLPSLASNGAGQLLCVYEKETEGKTLICLRMLISK
jgi:hypothetical protein